MNGKLLTILIPVYNTEIYLRKCLDSVVYSDYVELLDIICVNDGSKDGSLEILRDYENKYKESVRVVDKENGGHGSTINAGLDIAIGKYFRVLDSDDWFDTYNFNRYIEFLRTTDVDLVFTINTREYVYNGSYNIYPHNMENIEYEKVYELEKCDENFFGEKFIFRLSTSSYKLSVLKEAGMKLREKCYYVDTPYNLYAIPFTKTVIFLDCDIYRYFFGRPEQSSDNESKVKNYDDHRSIMKDIMIFYEIYKSVVPAVKLNYIKKYIIGAVYERYWIYLRLDKDKKRAYKRLREIDAEVKKTSPELYSYIGRKYRTINLNRKTGFLLNRFVFIENKLRQIYYF